MSEVVPYDQRMQRLTIRNEAGRVVGERVMTTQRFRLRGPNYVRSYPDGGDLYPAAQAQMRGWLGQFANQNHEIIYDENGRVYQVIIRDFEKTQLIATKTLMRDFEGKLVGVRMEEAVSGKIIEGRFFRDAQNKVTSVERTFTRRR